MLYESLLGEENIPKNSPWYPWMTGMVFDERRWLFDSCSKSYASGLNKNSKTKKAYFQTTIFLWYRKFRVAYAMLSIDTDQIT